MDTFSVQLKDNGGYLLSGDTLRLASEAVIVTLDGRARDLSFENSRCEAATLGRMSGMRQGGEARDRDIRVQREVFLSEDRRIAAVRVRVRNDTSTAVKLDKIEIMRMTRQEQFVVGGDGIETWKVLRYPFQKSDIPSYCRPTVVDKDFTDAAFSCIHATPGKGVIYNTVNVETRTVDSGPVMMIRNADRRELPILMMAVTDLRHHYIYQSLTTSEDRSAFASFNTTCDFLGVQLDPGDEKETHWLLIAIGAHESDLLGIYAETVADLHRLPVPRKPSPTVFCTWYFYTFLINEKYVLEELAAIKAKRVPLDVFQIDDGWMDTYGVYEPHPEKFPRGMAVIAAQIQEAGMTPGIWAAPFVIDVNSSVVQQHPDIYQRDQDGQRIIYATDRDCYVLDPTAPGAMDYLKAVLLKLKGWGYRYFKLDWLRAIYEFSDAVLHDPKVNRIEGYVLAMRGIREALGADVFILGCGGLADPGAVGLIDASRTSKDVRGIWNGPEGVPKSGAVIQLKQNLLRNYVNRFYHSDPDATQIRIRKERFSAEETRCVGVYQSEGHYTDEEAFTICAHQYMCGGLITISERFPELQDERLALLRHISPAITRPARILDYDTPVCPTLFLTDVHPECEALGDYRTLAIGNWEDHPVTRRLTLRGVLGDRDNGGTQAIFEFRTQRFLGLFGLDDEIGMALPPHAIRVMRMVPWQGRSPVILGTDLHLTGGAAEITALTIDVNVVYGRIETRWQWPVVVTAGFPQNGGVALRTATVPPGGGMFEIRHESKW